MQKTERLSRRIAIVLFMPAPPPNLLGIPVFPLPLYPARIRWFRAAPYLWILNRKPVENSGLVLDTHGKNKMTRNGVNKMKSRRRALKRSSTYASVGTTKMEIQCPTTRGRKISVVDAVPNAAFRNGNAEAFTIGKYVRIPAAIVVREIALEAAN